MYTNNAAYSKEITKKQLEEVIKYHNDMNYYHFKKNNCAIVATKSWNLVFTDDTILVDYWPNELKKNIQEKENHYSISLLEKLGVLK